MDFQFIIPDSGSATAALSSDADDSGSGSDLLSSFLSVVVAADSGSGSDSAAGSGSA